MLSASIRTFVFALLAAHGSCYVPASPTNSTNAAVAGGLNVTDISQIHLQWYPSGSYWQSVSYQLVGSESEGISQGALVHFSETNTNDSTPASSAPWIALVSCDFNATDADQELDIFTLARDKGARAALLYSLYSQACVINPEYADPYTYDQVFDIFATQGLAQSNLVEYQFGQLTSNDSSFDVYDSQLLNNSKDALDLAIYDGYVEEAGYLLATMHAYNATATANDTSSNGNGTGDGGNNSPSSSSQSGMAMIILYVITGCVSAAFIIVLALGAFRAIRHPERYGRRRFGAGGIVVEQSRARGLGRAILDTFPVVKFGGGPTPRRNVREAKDLEAYQNAQANNALAMREITPSEGDRRSITDREQDDAASGQHPRDLSGATAVEEEDVRPEAIGHETCPICIVDFEEGDDLRQLPCEGKHRFHQDCVDPWLLELSSSCPICRQDFTALDNMLRDGEEEREPAMPISRRQRFSRYVRSAVGRRRSRETAPSTPQQTQENLHDRGEEESEEEDITESRRRRSSSSSHPPVLPPVPHVT